MGVSTLELTCTEDVGAAAGGLWVEVVGRERWQLVVLNGELDIATAPLVRGVLETARPYRPRQVLIDMSGVTFIDAYSLGVLAAARRRPASAGIGLSFYRPSAIVRCVLLLTDAEHLFEVHREPLRVT